VKIHIRKHINAAVVKSTFVMNVKSKKNKCPHCGIEAGTYEVKGEIITNR
jgi:hypothetical protein